MLLGRKASETELKSLTLNTYRYLHFATHGILGNQIPGIYEPALVLATEKGTAGQDGYLTLTEVEKLNLNSDLAVLSACDTGSGEYFTGEGVMGLSRGFLLSGSRSVIVSLWPVASHATVELMSLFYENLRAGKSKAEALRSAQLSLMGQGVASASSERGINISGVPTSKTPLSHPFYWAPFVLIGD
jgi:CHAT domain-containing protein